MEHLKERLSGKSKLTIGYGHVGDSNLHVNISSETHSQELLSLIEPFIFDWTGEILHTALFILTNGYVFTMYYLYCINTVAVYQCCSPPLYMSLYNCAYT